MKRANQLLVKPEPKPSAQTVTLCDQSTAKLAALNRLVSGLMARSDLSTHDKALIELSLMYGMRVGSLLNIKSSDIKFNGDIKVIQQKGSMPVVCRSVFNLEFWLNQRTKGIKIYEGFSRFYYYRLFMKLGLTYKFEGNKKYSCTHLGRHLVVLNSIASGDDREVYKTILGHVNEKNIEYYEKRL